MAEPAAAPEKKAPRVPDAAKMAAALEAKKAAAAEKAAAAAAAAASGESAAASAKNAGGGGDSGTLPLLEGAIEGAVVTRFPPEPSGYLHIGHIKAVLLNDFYARHYKGRLIIRFDDTNPSKEKALFEENIIDDLAAVGIKGDLVTHTSDYFDVLAGYARDMIGAGNAYMDDTPQEQMRLERGECKPSRCRDASVEDNKRLFELMLSGAPEGKTWCLRAKIDMGSDNGTLRDPVLFRGNETPHHRTGTAFKAYPTYDFACPIVDSIEGVTHALRTNEYHDRDAQYAWIQAALCLRKVLIHEFSRLNFVFTLLSKRKLAWFADTGKVEGWYDPRFPTVQGVLRRGVTVPALREFILAQGASKRVLDMEWDKFWATNKKHVDPVAPRYTALVSAGRVPLTITSGEGLPTEPELRSIGLHPKNAALGDKAVLFGARVWLEAEDAASCGDSEEVTLMKWGNVLITKIERDGSGVPTAMEGVLNLAGDFKKTKKFTWIADASTMGGAGAAAAGASVPLSLVDFDFLITKPKIEEGDDFESCVNPHTKWDVAAVGEPAMRTLKAGDIVQLERKGFYRVDVPVLDDAHPMVLFAVPDGKPRATGVAARWAAAAAAAAEEEKKAAAAAKAGGKKGAAAPPAAATAAS